MTKSAPKAQAKKSNFKPPAARKRAKPPFSDMIPRIRSFVLGSAKPTIIRKIITKFEGNGDKKNILIKELSPFIFWDVDISKLDVKHNKDLIIERVYTRGLEKDEIILFKIYTWNEIKKTVVDLLELNESTIRYLSVTFNIKENKFKCCEKKPSRWNCLKE